MSTPSSEAIREALRRGGPATPDALSRRLGGVDRDSMMWAIDELMRQGSVVSTADVECGPDGICSTSTPTIYSLPA